MAAAVGASGTHLLDGDLEIVNITPDLYDQAVELFKTHFMKYEVVSIATNLLGSQQTVDEMDRLIREILKDGISFAASKRDTKELVAMAVNKILSPTLNCSLDEVFSTFVSKEMQCVGEYLERMENTYNIFKEWNIDCAMEIVFLSTRSDYNGRGLASTLARYSIDFARQMAAGNVPAHIKLNAAIQRLKPLAVCSVFTGRFSQRVGEKVGFQTLLRVPNTEFTYEGQTFAERVDPVHTHAVFAAIRF